MDRDEPDVHLAAGLPARLLAAVIPLAALVLVLVGLARGGLTTAPDEPVPPAAVAVLTLLAAIVLSYRSLNQCAELAPDRLVCRNLLVSFAVEWERVDALVVVRRPGVRFVELHVSDLRRRHRVGAATRFGSEHGDDVLGVLRSHPRAAAVLVDDTT